MVQFSNWRFDNRLDNKSFDLLWLFHYGCFCGDALGLTRYRKTQSSGEMTAGPATDGDARDGSSRQFAKG
jgi:hypothetical protein